MSTIGPEFLYLTNSSSHKTRKLDIQNLNMNVQLFEQSSTSSHTDHHSLPIQTTPNLAAKHINLSHQLFLSNDSITLNPKDILSSIDKRVSSVKPNHRDIRERFFATLLNESKMKTNNILVGNLQFLIHEMNSLSFKFYMSTGLETISGFESMYSFNDMKSADGIKEMKEFILRYNLNRPLNDSPITYQQSSTDIHDASDQETNLPQTFEPDLNSLEETVDPSTNTTPDDVVFQWYNNAKYVRSLSLYDNQDIYMLELYDMLHTAGAPMYLFEQLTSWAQRASSSFGTSKIPGRDSFLESISEKVYGKELSRALKPKSIHHVLPSSNSNLKLSVFSFKAQLTSLLLNEDIMHEDNLLLNLDNPFESLDHHGTLDDLDSGWWYKETRAEVCTEQTDILVPIILFIDAGKVTHRLSVEPITFTLGIFNRSTRANADAWRTLGYIENLDNSTRSAKRTYNPVDKLRDYHSIISVILEEYKSCQGRDKGMRFTLRLRGKTYNVTFKFAIQTVLGDCAGLDKLCLMYGSHNLLKARLCRDCMVTPNDSDDPYHMCTFISSNDVFGKSDDELNAMSLHAVPNAFEYIYFGARNSSIFDSTPSKPLHAILLGIVKYQFEVFEKVISKKTLRLINQSIQYYYNQFSRQSSKNLPSLAPFQNGVENCDVLGAKEQYARLFAIYISLMNPKVFRSLCNQKRKQYNHFTEKTETVDGLGISLATKWLHIVEDSLTFYQWAMCPNQHRDNLSVDNGHIEISEAVFEGSIAQNRVRKFMSDYKFLMKDRGGHGLKLVKFHQLLHYVKEILRDGSIQNIDTGRCESIAVPMYKRISKWTQRRQVLLTNQLAMRHYQYTTAEEAIRIQSSNMYSRKTDPHLIDAGSTTSVNTGSRFEFSLNPIAIGENPMDRSINLKWIGVRVDFSYHTNILQSLTKRLFLNTEDGGCLMHSTTVKGFTEFRSHDGFLYRAHPNFRGNGRWFDWCKIQWDEHEDAIPAKIIMFLDLTECEFMSEDDQENLLNTFRDHQASRPFVIRRNRNRQRIPFLNNGKWAVIRSGRSCNDQDLINSSLSHEEKLYNVTSSISSRIKLEEECRLVEVASIVGPCYALPSVNDVPFEECEEFFVLEDIHEWHDIFLTN